VEQATWQTEPRPGVRLVRHLVQPPERVWRALTDRAELQTWFPCDVVTDEWKVGASLTFVFGDDGPTLTGSVLELDEPRLLVFTWGDETLRFELTPDAGGGTVLILIDELAPGIAARNAAGWDVCLERLAGRTPAEDAWKPRFDLYVADFEPLLGPQEGPPAGVEGGSA
jgi:uncharacterized protein YndB with AHSA1/START domain